MDETATVSNNGHRNQVFNNVQEKIEASEEPEKKKTKEKNRNRQEAKENQHKCVQKTNSPKRKREPLQPTGNIPNHYPKKKRAVANQKKLYSMANRPLGYCLIINNYNFESTSLSNRRGTEKDKDELTRVFKKMSFEVEVRNDLQASEMQSVIKEYAERDHSKMDAFVCCILTHGEKGTVLGIDGKPVLIQELTQAFTQCCSLAGKPKLFFIQACQGKNYQEGVWMADGQEDTTKEGTYEEDSHTAARHSIPKDADFLLAIATVEHYRAFRHSVNGSIFIQELCKQLEEGCPQKKDILAILTEVNRSVSSSNFQGFKQMPEVRYTLTKALVLPMNSQGIQNFI